MSPVMPDVQLRSRYILCVDFDGVIHSYSSGWQGAAVISDPPVEGAFQWLASLLNTSSFEVNIYSSRSKEPGGIEAMRSWFRANGFPVRLFDDLKFPTMKPAASMTIDDRAFCFEGDFPSHDWLLRFKPWNKR